MRVSLEQAVKLLKEGQVVAVPTETVYGLAACLDSPKAIENIFKLKGRPSNNPLIVHLDSSDDLKNYVIELPPAFDVLARTFWPGALTVVLPAVEESVPENARAGLSTAAFRVPDHPLTLKLLQQTGPLVMPSANISGKPSATSSDHVETDFGADFPVLDGGQCRKGVESTILYWNDGEWVVARLGAIAPEMFNDVLGYIPKVMSGVGKEHTAPLCPGQMYRHYAPKAKLILTKSISEKSKEVVIGFSDRRYPAGCHTFLLGQVGHPEQAVHRLYSILRQLDHEAIQEAFVDMDFPEDGLWRTLRERLYKAANESMLP